MFKVCTGGDGDAFLLLDLNNPPAKYHDSPKNYAAFCKMTSNLSKIGLYQSPLIGLLDKNLALVDMPRFYTDRLAALETLPDQGEFEPLFQYQRQMAKILIRKSHLGIQIKEAYDQNARTKLAGLAEVCDSVAAEIDQLHTMREALWYAENKPPCSLGGSVYEIVM